jgi:urease accessory protein UreF
MKSAAPNIPNSDTSATTTALDRQPSASPAAGAHPDDLTQWVEIARQLRSPEIIDTTGLTSFLSLYQQRVLRAIEFPAILKAWHLTQNGHARDLIALDLELGKNPCIAAFAGPSRLIGQRQLRRLRPLRDHRVIQRYLTAVDDGQANGWHPLVFGMTLSVFSLPLYQGLMRHGEECLCGLTAAAATSHRLPQNTCRQSLNLAFAELPQTIEHAITAFAIPISATPHKLIP